MGDEMSNTMHTPGQRFRVHYFLSRLGEGRYTVEWSIDGKPWHSLRGPKGCSRGFRTEAAARAALDKATGSAS